MTGFPARLARLMCLPAYVATFILVVTAGQLAAFGTQVYRGYRPFVHAPGRVPFSWDMFANRVERCAMQWTPPLNSPVGPLTSLRQIGTGMEWDVVYDQVVDYQNIAQWLCTLNAPADQQRARFGLVCFRPDGTRTETELRCG